MLCAADFPYLVFTNTSGTSTVLSVANLTMTVSGTTLEVKNDEGTTSFVLTELSHMHFSDTLTAIDNVLASDEPVRVFTVMGLEIGEYGSLLEAVNALSAGEYILSNGKQSQKIVIR